MQLYCSVGFYFCLKIYHTDLQACSEQHNSDAEMTGKKM